ncbi:MAG: hypothetical protein LJE83_10325 [Gammaproteobacteria bacterium]|nr:hypothetical protein [Gammaproteobacteria bacterium]
MLKHLSLNLVISLLMVLSCDISAKTEDAKENNGPSNLEVYLLSYIQREPGQDEYEVSMLVSDRYIRIDEPGEDSGFIVYDDKAKTIYSVSHADKSVFVIKQHDFSEKDSPVKSEVEYLQLDDAPAVSGNNVFNYRVFTGEGESEETCLEIQLVENLLPDVSKILQNYQSVVAGQQVKLTDNKITELQPQCYFVDQVYNKAKYYEKGLPIQEWHSNESSRILSSYKKVKINKDKFKVPEKYRRFEVDKNSKIPIK